MTRGRRNLLLVWAVAFAVIVLESLLASLLRRFTLSFALLEVVSVLAWIVFIATTILWVAIAARYLLRRLFWRVGRRLALSYFLIGGLPFLFFAILVVVIGYTMAAVLSQAQFRGERAWFLSRLDEWNLEYTLTGAKPPAALETLEIYDSRENSASKLPPWLVERSFNGLVLRGRQAAFVSSRIYSLRNGVRAVVFVQPVDDGWRSYINEKTGMVLAQTIASADGWEGSASSRNRGRIQIDDADYEFSADENASLEPFFGDAFSRLVTFDAVVWGDLSQPLVEWETGATREETKLLTFLANPWANLLDYYFNSPRYLQVVAGVIVSLAAFLGVIYFTALLLASGLIFSITRAVNRIEKGSKAVERGDFSYRINLKARNQLGEVAQSFDRMTGSISTLLKKVAEQERLQSEIDIAATIQRNLLPKEGPNYRGVSFAAHFEPTASIGGDYYDVFNLDQSRLAVAIGDVSGHGLSTGLVMAMVKAAISTLVEEGADEVALFRRLNDLVLRSTEKRAFMTLAFTLFDLEKRTIRHTNAGHLYPYLLREGEPPTPIETPSLPLGLKPDIAPKTVELPLRERDTLVYLSDGIIEAQDERGEPFGFDQLERMLARLLGHRPSTIQGDILSAVARHSGSRPADDDRTIMVLRFDQIAGKRGRLEEPHESDVVTPA